MPHTILVMNFGSTSTKLAVYSDSKELIKESVQHDPEKLRAFPTIDDQKDFRRAAIDEFLTRNGYRYPDFDCVISRGANCKPIVSGVYEIGRPMLEDIATGRWGVHPTRVGVALAYDIGQQYHIPAVTADPPISDEFCTLARYSGIKEIARISSFHVLNHKAIARRYAREAGRNYEDLNLIVAHLGGGISVAAHARGKAVDANNALDGDGPFSPERAGGLPVGDLIKMCFSGKYTQAEMLKKVTGGGGLMSYLGTSSGLEVEKRIDGGDSYALEVFEAMAYQVSKEIGGAAAVLCGKADAILLTGSLAYSKRLTGWIADRVSWIAPIVHLAGENEMLSLAENATRYLDGEISPMPY